MPGLAARPEEFLQERRTLLCKQATVDLETVVQGLRIRQISCTAQRTGLLIVGTENNAPNPGLRDGPYTHDAGLKRHVQGCTRQTVVAQRRCRLSQYNDFGMSAGIRIHNRTIMCRSDKLSVDDDHSADWNFSVVGRNSRLHQRRTHAGNILFGKPHIRGSVTKELQAVRSQHTATLRSAQ